MMGDFIQSLKLLLQDKFGFSEATALTSIIVENLFGVGYPLILTRDIVPNNVDIKKAKAIVDRLLQNEPIQYILGKTNFMDLPFFVDASTLIPRPETEELVELVMDEVGEKVCRILDIGTGSGCIAVSLAKRLPNAIVSAWDFSAQALDMAKKNSRANGVDVVFERVDILKQYPVDGRYDYIVSNPPYVLELEKNGMEKNVLDYEPHSALFVPNDDALLFYEKIAEIAVAILNRSGMVFVEINQAKGVETKGLFESKGFVDCQIIRDMSRNDRIVRAQMGRG